MRSHKTGKKKIRAYERAPHEIKKNCDSTLTLDIEQSVLNLLASRLISNVRLSWFERHCDAAVRLTTCEESDVQSSQAIWVVTPWSLEYLGLLPSIWARPAFRGSTLVAHSIETSAIGTLERRCVSWTISYWNRFSDFWFTQVGSIIGCRKPYGLWTPHSRTLSTDMNQFSKTELYIQAEVVHA